MKTGSNVIPNYLVTFPGEAVLFSPGAFSDAKLTDAEVAKVKQALAAWGCEGGKYEKESEASGVLEAEDVKCKGGQYDFRLDKDFNVLAITRTESSRGSGASVANRDESCANRLRNEAC